MHCKTILIVEDDPGIRETLKLMLEIEGYSVIAASNGKEGLEVLKQLETPCLILLDLMMPVMDGWSFADIVCQDRVFASIPVVVVSAYADKGRAVHGVREILKKPVDLDSLIRVAKLYCS